MVSTMGCAHAGLLHRVGPNLGRHPRYTCSNCQHVDTGADHTQVKASLCIRQCSLKLYSIAQWTALPWANDMMHDTTAIQSHSAGRLINMESRW